MAALPAAAQTPAEPATIVYHFERVGLTVPVYTITLHEDGSGSYKATHLAVEGVASAGETNAPISLTPATTAKIFQDVRSTDHFHSRCESKAKNIADSGTKTLDYTGADGHASCTYNYTENKAVEAVTETFGAIQTTLEFGSQLEFRHRYDRLGLDALMSALILRVKEKAAIEVQVIAPTLTSIAMDGAVIERVRVAAEKLLQMSAK
jgi:hypothetical protein